MVTHNDFSIITSEITGDDPSNFNCFFTQMEQETRDNALQAFIILNPPFGAYLFTNYMLPS